MADVTINYKGSKIAEFSGGSKTLKTSGTYCEGDIEVVHSPNSKTYEITLAKASGWVLLTTLDAEVISHINDASLVVSLANISPYVYEKYLVSSCIASNTRWGTQGSYPVYGATGVTTSETATQASQVYYPPNKTDTSTSIGGHGMFRLNGSQYYFRPGGYYTRAGTYKLTFTW